MSEQFNIEKLRVGCAMLDLDLNLQIEQRFLDHLVLLQKWNRRLNLTAITDPTEMIVQHLFDSLSLIPFIKGQKILDIGTGGGFPGLPLAIYEPSYNVVLLDSRGKRIEFLRNVISKLKISNASVQNNRIEDYQPVEKFDTLTARAFSSIADLLNLSNHLLTSGTRVLAMKGKYPEQELASLSSDVIDRMRVEKLEVPFLQADRYLIIIDF